MTTPVGEKIISVAIPRPLRQLYSYRVPAEFIGQLDPGRWVKVPFGRTTTHGYVVDGPRPIEELDGAVPVEHLKSILSISEGLDQIPKEVFELCEFTARYYHEPLGEVLNSAASPAAMGHGVKKSAKPREDLPPYEPITLTESQESALEVLQKAPQTVGLLQGVTGSGKTEVYIQAARKVLLAGKSVLILVPEIALTHQLHQRFEKGLGFQVGLWHSALQASKRKRLWADLIENRIQCVLGARSAVFAPIQNLGLIVIDEEHDATYKQEDRAHYHARDVAIYRASRAGARTILGSATPCLETLQKVEDKKFALAKLEARFSDRAMPEIRTVDLSEEERVEGTQGLWAQPTIDQIKTVLARGEQVLVFLNRRGFAHFLLCEDCGEVAQCPSCSISLTVHQKQGKLVCHLCNHQEKIPSACHHCLGDQLKQMGSGTEGIEEDLKQLLPDSRITRLDRDQITSTRRLENVLNDFQSQKTNLMIGTQMLVKGHDFPNVTLVVVAFADGLFRWPDFRANERAWQTLLQVAGRSGRGEKKGQVLVQTFQPDHSVIQVLQNKISVESFQEEEKEVREACHYPPFGRLARIRVEHRNFQDAKAGIHTLAEAILKFPEIEILGPSEAFISRVKGIYRWDFLIKSKQIAPLQRALSHLEKVAFQKKQAFSIDVDPMSLG